MKKNTISHYPGLKTLLLCTLSFCLFLLGMTSAKAGEIFNSDFSKGKFDDLGWEAKGDWSIVDFSGGKPLDKNPGLVAKFSAKNTDPGSLTKKFDAIANPASLTLTFDGGFGWGGKAHSQGLSVMLLDADGNGYIFDSHRAKANWGMQWDVVTKYAHNAKLQFASTSIDTTQDPIVKGGGLRTFTITRDADGKWTFNGVGCDGGPLTFTDKTTTSFSQVVLVGNKNTDDLVFNKIKLEVTK